MDSCKYCGSVDLTDTINDVACCECGAEQGMLQFVNPYDIHSYVAPMEKQSYISKKRDMSDAASIAQNRLNIPDAVLASSTKMLDTFVEITGPIYKGQKDGYLYAALYYASRDTQTPLSRKKVIEEGGISCDDFTAACGELTKFLANTMWSRLFTSAKTAGEVPETNKILSRLGLSKDKEMLVRSKLVKIHERVSGHHSITSFHPATLAATLVFIAVKASKLDTSMKMVSKCAQVTVASIINVQRPIMALLCPGTK